MTKKKVFVAALAICVVAILSLGTLAWFTDTDSVSNQFLIADSDSDGEADFSVDVKESDDGGETWEDSLTFEDILPGDTVPKLAVVENTSTGSTYSQWIRVTIEVVGAPAWQSGYVGADIWDSLGIDTTVWSIDSATWNNATKTNTVVLYLREKLDVGKTATIFESVEIPNKLVNDADSGLNLTDFSINIKAEAIQSAHTGDSARSAFETYWGK